MQDNTITLAVDELNNATTVDHIYSRFEEYLNRSVYIGPLHALNARNTMAMYRTVPKPSGNFLGVNKTSVKFTKDVTVLGKDGTNLVAPIIFEVSCSIPVGVTNATVLLERQKVVAVSDRDDIMTALNGLVMV